MTWRKPTNFEAMSKAVKNKSSKKDFILEKASALFREKGFAATSMRDLAEAVGIEAASLYNHIQSKSEILQEIISRTANDCNVHMDGIEDPGMESIRKIESLIRFHVRMMLNRFNDYYVMVNEWIHLSEPFFSEFAATRRRYVQKMEAILKRGVDGGEMKPVLPYVAMLTILSSVRGLEFWHRSEKKVPPQVMEDNLVNHLIGGLKKN
jgi:AcrR family transcriptional regulator